MDFSSSFNLFFYNFMSLLSDKKNFWSEFKRVFYIFSRKNYTRGAKLDARLLLLLFSYFSGINRTFIQKIQCILFR